MSRSELPPALQILVDRQEILDCVTRYCAAVDRFDREMLLTVYHPDAIDDHGFFVGGPGAFVDWAFAYHQKYQRGHKHYILNHSCDIDGDQAHTETYWLFTGINNTEGPSTTLNGGRYLDRFEHRNGKWAIAARKCIIEWSGALGDLPFPPEALKVFAATGTARRDTSDPAYQRPLTIEREAFVLSS